MACNLKNYDILSDINTLTKINWKQFIKNIQVGDEVYIYV